MNHPGWWEWYCMLVRYSAFRYKNNGWPPPQKFENSRKTSRSCPLNLWIPIWLQLSFWVAEVGFKLQGSPGWFHNWTGKFTGQILEAWLFHSPKLILHHLAAFSRQLRLPSRNSGGEIFRTYASHRLEQVGPAVFGSEYLANHQSFSGISLPPKCSICFFSRWAEMNIKLEHAGTIKRQNQHIGSIFCHVYPGCRWACSGSLPKTPSYFACFSRVTKVRSLIWRW